MAILNIFKRIRAPKKDMSYINNPEAYETRTEISKKKMEQKNLDEEMKLLEKKMQYEDLLQQMQIRKEEMMMQHEERRLRIEELKAQSEIGTPPEDMMMLGLLQQILNKNQGAQPNQQQSHNVDQYGLPVFRPEAPQPQQTPQPQQEEEYPPSRFSDEQMRNFIKKAVPEDIIKQLKGLEEQEILQAYDIIKTL